MKIKRIAIISVLFVVVLLCIPPIFSSMYQHRKLSKTFEALRNLPSDRVDAAIQDFIRHQKESAMPLPASVSLSELVKMGYLHTNDVAAFDDEEAEVFLGAHKFDASEAFYPNAVWIRVHYTHSLDIVEFADGSAALERTNFEDIPK